MANSPLTTQKLLMREMERLGYSQKKMAMVLGISEAYLHEILHGKKSAKSRLFDFAEKLGVDLYREGRPIPIITWESAELFLGIDKWPLSVSVEGEHVFSSKITSAHSFGLPVVDDKMFPRYMPGDIIIVDPVLKCDNLTPCVVWINGEMSFKFYEETDSEIVLKSMNNKYPEIVVKKQSNVDFRSVGKVVDMIPKI